MPSAANESERDGQSLVAKGHAPIAPSGRWTADLRGGGPIYLNKPGQRSNVRVEKQAAPLTNGGKFRGQKRFSQGYRRRTDGAASNMRKHLSSGTNSGNNSPRLGQVNGGLVVKV